MIGMLPPNPYDLHEINFNDTTIYARPVEWNGSMVDQKTMKNAFNTPVQAIKLTLTCPNCSIGVDLDISMGLKEAYYCECQGIKPVQNAYPSNNITNAEDPFQNPFETGLDLNKFLYGSMESPIVKPLTKNKKNKSCKANPKAKVVDKEQLKSDKSETDKILDLANQPFDDSDLLE